MVESWVKWVLPFYLFCFLPFTVAAQRLLTLDSCRALALRNNKQLAVSKVKQDVAANVRRAARTTYLPRVNAVGAYMHTSREISILNDDQKSTLSNLGTNAATGIGSGIQDVMGNLPANVQQVLGAMGLTGDAVMQILQPKLNGLATSLNGTGEHIVDAFRTDTRNIWAGSVVVTQPVFMGGALKAINNMADIAEEMACNSAEASVQSTLYDIDKAYWTVVSLTHKKQLAESYLELVSKLSDDVDKMIQEGVATRSEGLSVDVKENEAEMMVTQVNDGLVLSKMLLCQLCGLPLNEQLTLAEENVDDLVTDETAPLYDVEEAIGNRPEMRLLQNTVDLSKQATKLLKAGNLPQVAVLGGYTISNPNNFNGFEKKFGGVWNIGVMVRVPIWNWGDVAYKVRASKGLTTMAQLEMNEAREKMELQINQSSFKLSEAGHKLSMSQANIKRAEENLRTANLGFQEGVISATTVMEAQTAWLQAKSQKIDAEIDVKLSQVNLRKAIGMLK